MTSAARSGAARPDDVRRVVDAMLADPLVLPGTATLADVRAVFLRDHVHMVLLTPGGQVGEPLQGTLLRTDLDAAVPEGLALDSSRLAGRTVSPTQPLDDARRALRAAQLRRAAVVDDHGVLVGLLCLKRDGSGFCSDVGVAERRAAALTHRPRAR